MDQTIILRSSHVGVSRCLRLIGLVFVKCCLNDSDEELVIFRNSDGKVEHGASYSETSISYRLNC